MSNIDDKTKGKKVKDVKKKDDGEGVDKANTEE